MWRVADRRLVLALLALAGGAAWADEPPKQPPAAAPPAPGTPAPPPLAQVTDAVLSAAAKKDEPTLKALAGKDDPDPWLVADELIRRGEFDAADAFARAAPRADVEQLPSYVASRRGKPDDAGRRDRVARASAALAAKHPREALDLLGPPESAPLEDVVGIRLRIGRALSLEGTGRLEDASSAHLAAAEAAEKVGWLSRASALYQAAGAAAFRANAYARARAACDRRLAVCAVRGDQAGAARTLASLGLVHHTLGEFDEALSTYERALRIQEALPDRAEAARTLSLTADVYESRGDHETALGIFARALARQEELGDAAEAAVTLGNMGNAYLSVGEYAKALAAQERALALKEARGNALGAAATLGNIGSIHRALGDYARALADYRRALAVKEVHGDRRGAAMTLNNVGTVHFALGEFSRALSAYERALETTEAIGDRPTTVAVLTNIGSVQTVLGARETSLSTYGRALEVAEAMGDRSRAAVILGNIGIVHRALGHHPQALASLERARAAQVALGDRADAARTLSNIGGVQQELGDHAAALATYQRAMTEAEAVGDRDGAATTLSHVGVVHLLRGDFTQALATLGRALELAKTTGNRPVAAMTLGRIGGVHEARGDLAQAITFERRAAEEATWVAVGLGEEEGPEAREPISFAVEVGARSATAVGDSSALAYFLEIGRAGALLEALRARQSLGSAALPEDLRIAEATARRAEASTTSALRLALATGDMASIRTRRDEVAAARERLSGVIARIQREGKAGAELLYPKPASLDELRAALLDGDAMVLYGLLEQEACALVVLEDAAHVVRLGPTTAIEKAIEGLGLGDRSGDPTGAREALSRLVVAPLALPPGTKRLLLSPDGPLSYVPFATLMPDVTVAYVASGTTYRTLLADGAARGSSVLAVGDPDYEVNVDEKAVAMTRGALGRLARLPATGDEARAVGDVTLLRRDATEAGLRDAVAKHPRWRAVHLACHGLVDTERPALSSLALTAAGDDDGFLTALEVFRMKIPADLVVLSACETGKGKLFQGEGLVGLTRAFMFAGAPRVICSLWKVDDDATRALMTRFYELWNPKDGKPGLPTAEALRSAQEFVRSREKWKHPYYWAAWVLWGLPS